MLTIDALEREANWLETRRIQRENNRDVYHSELERLLSRNRAKLSAMTEPERAIRYRSQFAFVMVRSGNAVYLMNYQGSIMNDGFGEPIVWPILHGEPDLQLLRDVRSFAYEYCFSMGHSEREINKGFLVDTMLAR